MARVYAGYGVLNCNYYLNFSTKSYVEGNPNNRFKETVLLNTQDMCLVLTNYEMSIY